jgi:DegV family protein with EDD domain
LHVVLDSTASVSAEYLAANPNLHIVPLTVRLGERQWSEEGIKNDELFTLSKQWGVHPKSSQPAPGDFVRVIGPLVAAGNNVIIITLSGSVSGTIQSANAATQLIEQKNLWVVDSGTTATGMVKMAEEAFRQAARGLSPAAIVARLEKLVKHTKTMFVPATLEYLHKGGRIGGAATLIGSILQIKPVLYLVDGKVAVLDKVRTHQRAIARMVEELKKTSNLAYAGIVHIEAEVQAMALKNELQALYPSAEIAVSSGGAVLATHLGPGMVGLIYQERISDD